MRGTIINRNKGTKKPARYVIVIDRGYVVDPATGKKRRRQEWHSCGPDAKSEDADRMLNELVGQAHNHRFIRPSKTPLVEYLRAWFKKVEKNLRPETLRVYRSLVETHLADSPIANVPLRDLAGSDLEALYAALDLAPASLTVLHACVRKALQIAVRDRILATNPADDATRPKVSKADRTSGARRCWNAEQTRSILAAAATATPQVSAFIHVAFDSGARRSELCGLKWSDLAFDTSVLRIERQLDVAGEEPTFGPTKTKAARTIVLNPETVMALRAHKKAQAALKLRNRTTYQDFNLVFARQEEHLTTATAKLGQPVKDTLVDAFHRVVKASGAPPLKFHATRHTCASLALSAGVPVHEVAARLGHAQATTTLATYAHVLDEGRTNATERLGRVLFNR